MKWSVKGAENIGNLLMEHDPKIPLRPSVSLVKSGIFVSFLVYGLIAGVLSVILWLRGPDSIFLLNAPPIWIGDAVYNLAIDHIGDPSSPQAHYTIPWALRIPQVYLLTSAMFWGAVGAVFAWMKAKREVLNQSSDK